MATIKSYTDLQQSKKLAEILPIETADMCYRVLPSIKEGMPAQYTSIVPDDAFFESDIPAWSLAALLNVLESEIDGEEGETYQLNIEKDGTWWNVWYKEQYDEANPIETESTEELIDACVNMIEKLHELDLL